MGNWSSCSKSCEGGTKERTRECRDANEKLPPSRCGGTDEKRVMKCNTLPCAEWTPWETYCDNDCGAGRGFDHRICVLSHNNSIEMDTRYCRGKEEDKTGPWKDCVDMRCPGWQAWTDVDGICSQLCGGGLKDQTRLCHNKSGIVVNPADYPDLCPGLETQEAPCNTHDCPDPMPCDPNYPFAIQNETVCCRYEKRTAACDGTDILVTDPPACCRAGATWTCPTAHLGGICFSRPDRDAFCENNPLVANRMNGDIGFQLLPSTMSYYDAEKTCADTYLGTLLTFNESGLFSTFQSNVSTSGNYWTSLRQLDDLNPSSCTDGTCDNQLFWT